MAIKSPVLIALAVVCTISIVLIAFLYLDEVLVLKHSARKSRDATESSTSNDRIIKFQHHNRHNSTTADISANASTFMRRSLLSIANMFIEQIPSVEDDLNSLTRFAYLNFDHSFNSSSFKAQLIKSVQKKLQEIEEKYDILKKQFPLFYNQSRSDKSVENLEKKFRRVHGLLEAMDRTPIKKTETFVQLLKYKPFRQTMIKYSLISLSVFGLLVALCSVFVYWLSFFGN